MKKITTRMCSGGARAEDPELLLSIADQIATQFVPWCTSWPVQSFIAKFRDEFEAKAKAQALLRKQGENPQQETTLI